jgi:hypothetical protein
METLWRSLRTYWGRCWGLVIHHEGHQRFGARWLDRTGPTSSHDPRSAESQERVLRVLPPRARPHRLPPSQPTRRARPPARVSTRPRLVTWLTDKVYGRAPFNCSCRGTDMISQADLLKAAAECDQLMQQETDCVTTTAFRLLRDMWTLLAKESSSMSPQQLAREVATIKKIQSRLGKGTAN